MQAALYKCCYCLQTVVDPVVMCHKTHVGCFDCVCEHLRHTSNNLCCPMCRDALHLRFDRLIMESSLLFRRSKRRKTESTQHSVFLKLLSLKEKDKYRPFTRTMRKFANATKTSAEVDQMNEDIDNIVRADESIKRLQSQRLYEQRTRMQHV